MTKVSKPQIKQANKQVIKHSEFVTECSTSDYKPTSYQQSVCSSNRVNVALTGPKSIPSHCKIGQGAHDVLKAFYLISLPAPTFFSSGTLLPDFFCNFKPVSTYLG